MALLASAQRAIKSELSVLTMSDDEIKKQICETHVHADRKFDARSLFVVVKNVLNSATVVVDNVVLGTAKEKQENQKEEAHIASFSPPSCVLKQLSSEMACKAAGEEIAHKTTMSMLNKLSSYSWDAKAVLILAAFALEYGEFWLLGQLHPSNQLAKLLGILKGVPTISKRQWLKKHEDEIVNLNNLVKVTLKVVEYIFDLVNSYNIKDVPALSTATDHIPVDVYWAIISIATCTTQIYCLIKNEYKTPELFPFNRKMNDSLELLKKHIEFYDEQMNYLKLVKILGNPGEIVVTFKEMSFQPLIDGSTKKEVDFEVMKSKNVFLLFSSLGISDEDISIFECLFEVISKNDQYKIVWIPIVEGWTNDMQKKFEMLQPKMPPLYIVHNFSFKLGMKYIQEKWQFNDKPIVVVMNSQGVVEHPNALRMTIISGMKAFPFTIKMEKELSNGEDWFTYLMFDSNPKVPSWIIQGKYIFFYGGKDKWVQQFTKKVTELLANDQVIENAENAKMSIDLSCVGKGSKEKNARLESFLSSRTHKKAESEWVVLCKGSKLVDGGYGSTMLKVLEKFEKSKLFMRDGFEHCFRDYHDQILQPGKNEIVINAGIFTLFISVCIFFGFFHGIGKSKK